MRALNADAALTGHKLRRILDRQGPTTAMAALESFGPPGDALRQHWPTCADCANVKRELYGDRDIPVNSDPLTPELLELLRELDG